MKRIIHVFGKMNCGGAETRTMEIYRKINREEIQFDFLTMNPGHGYYDDEIKKLGGRIFIIPSPSKVNAIKHIKDIISVLKCNGPFHAVHAHTSYHTGIVSLAAYLAGVRTRICHSRSASNPKTKGLLRKIYFLLMRICIKLFATNMIACGEKAGIFLYGKDAVEKGNVKIIRNAIDFEPYRDIEFRNPKLRKELNIGINTMVIGHVGSFSPVKNHEFLIKIVKELNKEKVDFIMILIGEGKLRKKIEMMVQEEGIEDSIVFLGLRSDIPHLMSMFDVLLLPSFYEGIPGVVIEAQAAGTPCIVSDTVTKEVSANLGLVEFLSIKNEKAWSKAIINKKIKPEIRKEEIYSKLNENGFTVEHSVASFRDIYKL